MGAQQALGNAESVMEGWYKRYPDLDHQIIFHILAWRDSVKVGTIVSIADMMNFAAPGRHGMPGEVVLDLVFPKHGKCPVEGVKGVTAQLSPEEIAAGHAAPKSIQRTV